MASPRMNFCPEVAGCLRQFETDLNFIHMCHALGTQYDYSAVTDTNGMSHATPYRRVAVDQNKKEE